MKIEKKKFTAAQIAGGVIGGLAVGAMLSMPSGSSGSGDEQGSAQDKQTQTQSQAVREVSKSQTTAMFRQNSRKSTKHRVLRACFTSL